ncbi:MAG: hypothetical protein K2G91_05525 [Prevotella sp.]|nr:hypothetical protein [Prevotella sp.]
MTTKAVNRLIDKYLEGKTSPEEERQLVLEVNRHDAPAEWKVVSEMLGNLTLGDAIYENTMAHRRYHKMSIYIGWAVAACIAFMVVMGYVEQRNDQQKEPVELMAQDTPTDAPTMVTEMLHEPEPAVVEATAYTPKVKKSRKIYATLPSPIVMEKEEKMIEEPPVQPAMQVSEAEIAQVEEDFRQWQLRWMIQNEAIDLEIATEQLNKKYAAYLAENKNNIEI